MSLKIRDIKKCHMRVRFFRSGKTAFYVQENTPLDFSVSSQNFAICAVIEPRWIRSHYFFFSYPFFIFGKQCFLVTCVWVIHLQNYYNLLWCPSFTILLPLTSLLVHYVQGALYPLGVSYVEFYFLVQMSFVLERHGRIPVMAHSTMHTQTIMPSQ